jgi:hypothetical protein
MYGYISTFIHMLMQNRFPAKNSAKNPVFSKLCLPGPDIEEKGGGAYGIL